ncbi:MAG: glycosyltransferase family 2 protein, partial [Lachnospiraceae bacterium]|nr:glycosyltransferase family 2 protein [Lachnospiraceae bacterium]
MVGISAVIPCYKAKHEYIYGVLDSVLAQTFQDYEVVLVDDGNPEEYRKILAEAAQKDHRIRLITQEHKGTSAARNLGVEEATGKYIIFIDADDYAFPWHFQEAFRIAEETQAEIVYAYECCGRSADISVGHVPDPRVVQKSDHWLASNFIGKSRYLDDKMYFGRASYSRIIRREVALKIKFQEGVAIGEDILWNLAILENTSKRYVVESAWYIYIIREDSITQKYNPDMNE